MAPLRRCGLLWGLMLAIGCLSASRADVEATDPEVAARLEAEIRTFVAHTAPQRTRLRNVRVMPLDEDIYSRWDPWTSSIELNEMLEPEELARSLREALCQAYRNTRSPPLHELEPHLYDDLLGYFRATEVDDEYLGDCPACTAFDWVCEMGAESASYLGAHETCADDGAGVDLRPFFAHLSSEVWTGYRAGPTARIVPVASVPSGDDVFWLHARATEDPDIIIVRWENPTSWSPSRGGYYHVHTGERVDEEPAFLKRVEPATTLPFPNGWEPRSVVGDDATEVAAELHRVLGAQWVSRLAYSDGTRWGVFEDGACRSGWYAFAGPLGVMGVRHREGRVEWGYAEWVP